MPSLNSVFEKFRFQIVFRPHKTERKAGVFKLIHFEERFRKVPFSLDNLSEFNIVTGPQSIIY